MKPNLAIEIYTQVEELKKADAILEAALERLENFSQVSPENGIQLSFCKEIEQIKYIVSGAMEIATTPLNELDGIVSSLESLDATNNILE